MIENYEGLTEYLEQIGMDLEDYSDENVINVVMPILLSRIDLHPNLTPSEKEKWKKDLFAPSLPEQVRHPANEDVLENVSPNAIRDFLILWGHEVAAARANRSAEDMGKMNDLLSAPLIIYIRLRDTLKQNAANFPAVAEPVLSRGFANWVVDGETLLDYMWSNFTVSILRDSDVDAWRESKTAYDTFATFFNNMKYLAHTGATLRGRPVRALADYTRLLRVLSLDDMGDRVPVDEKLIQQASDIFKWFADQGADFENVYGFIALSNTGTTQGAEELLPQLVKYGATLSSENRTRQNVFFYDLTTPAFDYLVSLPGAKELINAKTEDGFTPIMYVDSPEMFDALLAHGADIESAVTESGNLFHYVVYSFVDSDNVAHMNHFLDWIQAQLDAAETPAQLRAALNRLSRQLHIHHKNQDDLTVTEYLSRQLRDLPDDESLQRAFRYAVLLSGEVFHRVPSRVKPLMMESLKVREYIEREYLARPQPTLSKMLPADMVKHVRGLARQQELCAELDDLDISELVALARFLGVDGYPGNEYVYFLEKDILCRDIAQHLAQGGSRSEAKSPVPKTTGVEDLIWAIGAGAVDKVYDLLSLGQDPNELAIARGKRQRPLNVALDRATTPERIDIVKLLLRAGADPTLRNQGVENAVAKLSTLDHSKEDQLKALLAPYVDFNAPEFQVDWLMGKLYAAITQYENPETHVARLLETPANAPANYLINGMTPVEWVEDMFSKDPDYPRDEIIALFNRKLK